MKLTLGENIKNLRKERNITQEEFSEMLGVSYQSVSRWETGTCYPDMELLPEIADFFSITVDRLIGADKTVEQKEVDEFLLRFQQAISVGEVYECIAIAREGVKAYPNNYILLNKLMEALFVSGDSDGNIPEWHENMLKNDAEITALGERIMKYCPDQSIRLEATARLAFNHCLNDRKDLGRKLYETLPSVEYCMENQIWWALDESEEEIFLRKKIKTDYENLKSSIWLLSTIDCVDDKEKIEVINKVFELENLMSDNNITRNTWGEARLNLKLALCYINSGDTDNALKYLRLCVETAKAFDERPDEQSYNSLLFGTVIEKRIDFETSDNRTLYDIVKYDWSQYSDFDPIKDSEEFKTIFE